MSPQVPVQSILLLGRDHIDYGNLELTKVSDTTVAAISVGADRHAASAHSKKEPNEDAALVIEEADRTLLAVADAHFGAESSHQLMEGIRSRIQKVPATLPQLAAVFWHWGKEDTYEKYRSETTLAIAVYDRPTRSGFGLVYGDSTVAIVGPERDRPSILKGNASFVTPGYPSSLLPRRSRKFKYSAKEGDLMVAYTDGVDECHYASPKTSVTPGVMQQIFQLTRNSPRAYVNELVRTALAGVDGNPGGQDNIAVAATRT